jgi:hypothetical protein
LLAILHGKLIRSSLKQAQQPWRAAADLHLVLWQAERPDRHRDIARHTLSR